MTQLYYEWDIQCHSLIAHEEQTYAVVPFVCFPGARRWQYKNVNIGFWCCLCLDTQASEGTGGKYGLRRHAGNHMAPHNMGAKSGAQAWHGPRSGLGHLSTHGISFICKKKRGRGGGSTQPPTTMGRADMRQRGFFLLKALNAPHFVLMRSQSIACISTSVC